MFAPETARTLIGSVFEAASGDAIWRSASFLAGKLGETIAAPNLTIVDDNTMLLTTGAGGFGTSPFDDEGLPSLRTVVVENGVLRNYLLNTYTARKLGMKSTHNAARGLAGAPGIGCGNLFLEPGTLTPEEIIGGVPAGLYVTSLMGFGTNLVTGDYSRGATGLWIENGQLTHAVEEVTIAGNLAEMLRNVTADRQRPGFSRIGGFANAAHRWNDDRREVRAGCTADMERSEEHNDLHIGLWPSLSQEFGIPEFTEAIAPRRLVFLLYRARERLAPWQESLQSPSLVRFHWGVTSREWRLRSWTQFRNITSGRMRTRFH